MWYRCGLVYLCNNSTTQTYLLSCDHPNVVAELREISVRELQCDASQLRVDRHERRLPGHGQLLRGEGHHDEGSRHHRAEGRHRSVLSFSSTAAAHIF